MLLHETLQAVQELDLREYPGLVAWDREHKLKYARLPGNARMK
jgi:hypothetical protein